MPTRAVAVVLAATLAARGARGEHPRDASNWQGKHACDAAGRAAKPRSVRDVSEAVYASTDARANGAGHSWHSGLFCAANGGTRVDVSETRAVRAAERFALDEGAMAARADAGMLTRDLLDGLARRGYTLPAFPWFIDQTIGGAIATASHGSSLRAGSLSSQMVACTLVKADGSVEHFSEGTTPAPLFDALRANIGRLGVVVDVTLRVVKNTRITRRNEDVSPEAFVNEMRRVQDAVRACERDYAGN